MVGNMKILLVEDEENLRKILEKRLKKQFTVDVCGDGRAALDFLEVYGYDIVLLDIMLPKVDGLSVLREMRKRKLDTPVILLTAKNLVEYRDGCSVRKEKRICQQRIFYRACVFYLRDFCHFDDGNPG